jgi:autotransporter-associated beta strand protein
LATLPHVTTETGWPSNLTADPTVQGKIVMDMYLDEFKSGTAYTAVYKFADSGDTWGLIDTAGRYKQAATDLHNLTTILGDTSSPTTLASLNYSIAAEPSTMHDMLLQKHGGTFELAVWNEQVTGSSTVMVSLGATYPVVRIYDPRIGTSVVQTLSNVSSVALTLSDHPNIIELPVFQATTYTLTATASVPAAHVAPGTATSIITTTLTNTGTYANYNDSMDYTSLAASSVSPAATLSASGASGGNLIVTDGTNSISTSQTLTFSTAVAGTYTLTPSAGTVTNTTVGGNAACTSATPATVQVYTGQGTWTGSGATVNWSDYGNWDALGGAPGIYAGFTSGDSATFAGGSGNTTVHLNTSSYLTTLTFNSPATSYSVVAGGGTLNMSGSGAAISVTGGHSISAPVALLSNTTITTNTPASTLTISGPISGSGTSLTAAGSGLVVLSGNNSYSGGTAVTGGTLQTRQVTNSLAIASGAKMVLTASGGTNPNASIVSAGGLSIASGGSPGILDLTDNALIVTGATTSTDATIASLIAGGEITSSVVSTHTGMTIAYDFANNIGLNFANGFAIWGGQTISQGDAGSDLLVLPTLQGDLNMDGAVNFTDVSLFAPNLGKSTGQTWGSGDLDGDGAVNFTDVSLMAPNLGKTVASVEGAGPGFTVASSSPSNIAAAPEPVSLLLLAFGGLVVARRARRHG